MSIDTLYWLLWGLAFVAWEAKAVLNKKQGDTLSEQVWWLNKKTTFAGRGALAGFMVVLTGHFLVCPWANVGFFC